MKNLLIFISIFFYLNFYSFSQNKEKEQKKEIKEAFKVEFSEDKKFVLNENGAKFWNTKHLKEYKDIILKEIQDAYENFSTQTEFETEEMFEKRLKEGEKIKISIIKKYKKIYEEKNKEKVIASFEKINLKIDVLGAYDAEEEIYNIVINGKTEKVNIPRKEARALKQNLQDVEVKAEKQLLEDGETYDIFNIIIYHPTLEKKYLFGKRKKAIIK
ncbi:MAG: hypothetical protein B6I24_06390 [Bacteroidetes bacterium 4572_128]|nr:MAG: hypothetical protein B6I24_06390 [Bacteroidetes bacterium 4572_128]